MPGHAIRPSQFVLNYGVGSIIETPEGPVIIPDFEKWGRIFGRGRNPSVEEFVIPGSDVASGLLDNGLVFRIPTNTDVSQPENQPIFDTIPFPGWALCVRHAQLYELQGGRTLCSGCVSGRYTESDIKKQAIRFVRACEDGHLDDVDWPHLVHISSKSGCNSRRYSWVLHGSSLKEVTINCTYCGSSTTLSEVYIRTRTSVCTGRFPEKGTALLACDKKPSVLLRGSSSLRIPDIISVIPIPPDSSPLYQALDNREMIAVLATQKSWTKDQLVEKLQEVEGEAPYIYDPLLMDHLLNATNEKVIQVIEDLKKSKKDRPVRPEDAKSREFHALQAAAQYGRPPDPASVDTDFQVKVQEVSPSVPFHSRRLRVTPIERLSVIMVQRGYRRLNTDNRLVETSYYDGRLKYFPGIKLKGEGIFIDGGKNSFTKIASDGWTRKHSHTKNPYSHPVAVWWHTLAHRIISSLSIESGYSSAAIRENVYVHLDENAGTLSGGILIYTTQQGGDGSLGGLIALVPEFESVLNASTRNINMCSNDPLCSEETINPGKYNGAACYACLLLSETSCSQRNMNLDRNLLRNNL